MNCPKCWKAIPEDSKFCQFCGYKFEVQKILSDVAENPSKKEKNGMSKLEKILICVSTIILIGLAVLGLILGNQISELNAENASLNDEISTLNASLKQSRTNYNNLNNSLQEAKKFSDPIRAFSTGKDKTFKKAKEFFAESNAIVVPKGETYSLKVYCSINTTVYFETESGNAVSSEWSKNWSGYYTSVNFTGVSSGTSILKFYNDANSKPFYVLIIVP